MDKKNKLILIILIVLTLLVVGVCTYQVLSTKEKDTDAIKFCNEYSELNGEVNELNGKNYVNVSISDNNTVKYVTEEEAYELLKDGTGVIYFGFSTCPWCRSLVSTLTSVAEEEKETIYYLDILNIRSAFELEDGKLNKIKDGTKGYYKLLDILDNELEEFYLEDAEGNRFDTEEKRLYAPTLIAFNQGKVTSIHVGTVDSQENGYDELNDTEIEELEKIIKKLIASKDVELCTSDKC